MHKLLFSTFASVTFIMPFVLSPSASAKWIKVYTNQADGSSHYYENQKIMRDGYNVYYSYRIDYSYPSAEGVQRVKLNVAVNCLTRSQKVLEVVRYGLKNRVIDRQSLENGYYNPSSSIVFSGTVEESIFNSVCPNRY